MAILEEFLSSILTFVRAKDATKLQLWLRVEPPLPPEYAQLGAQLKASYSDSNALEGYIEKLLPENNNAKAAEGDVWPGFLAFMKEYLEFWRDVNFDNLLETHGQLNGLVKLVTPSPGNCQGHTDKGSQFLHHCAIKCLIWYHHSTYSSSAMRGTR
jgi:hypothetical protein